MLMESSLGLIASRELPSNSGMASNLPNPRNAPPCFGSGKTTWSAHPLKIEQLSTGTPTQQKTVGAKCANH